MAKIEPYEKHADAYDDWYSRNRSAYESELGAIGHLLPGRGKGVEIGVGTGRFAAKFGIPFGIEPSMAMGKIARERGIAVIRGVAEALPLSEGRFDFMLMVTTLCFFDDVEKAMREAYRVLAPAGSLVIGLIDRESPFGMVYEEHKCEHRFYRDATFRSAREAAAFLENAGFRSLSFCQTIFRNPAGMDRPDPVREGHGEGGFVVVRADK
jgi:SAM-dependent methyltransferase